MKILWPNIVALGLFLTALIIALRERQSIHRFLTSISHFGPGYPPDERTLGLIAFGLVAVSLMAALKILTRKP